MANCIYKNLRVRVGKERFFVWSNTVFLYEKCLQNSIKAFYPSEENNGFEKRENCFGNAGIWLSINKNGTLTDSNHRFCSAGTILLLDETATFRGLKRHLSGALPRFSGVRNFQSADS